MRAPIGSGPKQELSLSSWTKWEPGNCQHTYRSIRKVAALDRTCSQWRNIGPRNESLFAKAGNRWVISCFYFYTNLCLCLGHDNYNSNNNNNINKFFLALCASQQLEALTKTPIDSLLKLALVYNDRPTQNSLGCCQLASEYHRQVANLYR